VPMPILTKAAAANAPAPKSITKTVGRAVVLAHGVGGSSTHASMKAWKQQFAAMCDEVIMVDFPRPHKVMRDMAATFASAILSAYREGHRRIVLAGVSMGARAALVLLTGVADDDGEPVALLSAEVRECICGVVALGYPLVRPGTEEVRDRPIRSLPAEGPPLLVVCGSDDRHAPQTLLAAALDATPAATAVHCIEGTDGVVRAAEGTHAQREATAALDARLAAFVDSVLGAASQWSKQVKQKLRKKAPSKVDATELAARQLQQLEAAQLRNHEEQLRLKGLDKQLARESQDAAAAARQRAAAVPESTDQSVDAVGRTDVAAPGQSASSPASPSGARLDGVPSFRLAGCGNAMINGLYHPDQVRDGVPSYRQEDGTFTIERDSAPGQLTQWCLCEDYGFVTHCYVDSEDVLPPTSGWVVSDACEGPAPSLFAVEDKRGTSVFAQPCSKPRHQSKSSRRRKAVGAGRPGGIARNGLNRKRLKR